MFKMPNAVKIMGRSSTITNSFVNSIIPLFHPTNEEVADALSILGMTSATMVCVYCGDRASEWDHLRPLVKRKRPTGYVSEIANLVPACGKCNQSKGASYWRDWMLGPAKQSPFSRAILDLEARVERLAAYENWRVPRHVDFEALAGDELWQKHWHNHARLMELMVECQQTAEEIRLVVKAASSVESPRREAATIRPGRAPAPRQDPHDPKPVGSIDKKEAIRRTGLHATRVAGDSHFANINGAKDVWWLDIPLRKLDSDNPHSLDVLLYDGRDEVLHHLRVPTSYLRVNLPSLTVRNNKQCIHLELKSDNPHQFRNVAPISSRVDFAQFEMKQRRQEGTEDEQSQRLRAGIRGAPMVLVRSRTRA